jgi:hypothetical protein
MLAPVVCVQVRLPELTDFTDYETAPLKNSGAVFLYFYQDFKPQSWHRKRADLCLVSPLNY